MHHGLGPRGADELGQAAGVVHVTEDRLRAQGGDRVVGVLLAGQTDDVVPGGDQGRNQVAADDTRAAGEEDPHRCRPHFPAGRGARRSARAASSSSVTKVSISCPGAQIITTTNRLQESARLFAAW